MRSNLISTWKRNTFITSFSSKPQKIPLSRKNLTEIFSIATTKNGYCYRYHKL